MTKKQLRNLIRECISEVKLVNVIKEIVNETLKPMKFSKQPSLEAKMEELAEEVSKANKDAKVVYDDNKRYNVCDCDPHYFSIHPMTDDSFDVTYFKNKTDRTKKFNLNFEELTKYVTETLKENGPDFGQKKWEKCAANSVDKDGKKNLDKPQETDEKVKDAVENKDDLPTSPMKSVEKIKKQADHSVKDANADGRRNVGKFVDYKYPKQKDDKIVIKQKQFKAKGRPKKD